MVLWMTTTENRALELAVRRGYLSCRRNQRTLSDQFAQHCCETRRPILRVERQGGQGQVVLQWHRELPPLRQEQQDQLRALLKENGSPPGLLPIVFRYGAYSAFLSQEAALELAEQLAGWVEEQFTPQAAR